MADNVAIRDGSDNPAVAATQNLSDGSQAPKVVLLQGDGSTTVVAPPSQAQMGPVTETAPSTDIASSGLNGRLQRIAQRITSLIAQIAATPFSHGVTVTGTFTPSASYAVDNCIGGQLTVATGLPAGTRATLQYLSLAFTAAALTATAGVIAEIFNQSPSTSFADAVTPSYNSGDPAKIGRALSLGTSQINSPTGNGLFFVGAAPNTDFVVDASGNIYIALISSGTYTLTTPGPATWQAVLRY
jgi:hypothetical protein